MKKLYLWAEKIWFRFPQKLRFLFVGGFNTVFAYLVLNLLNILFGLLLKDTFLPVVIANLALIIQYILTINVSFLGAATTVEVLSPALFCFWGSVFIAVGFFTASFATIFFVGFFCSTTVLFCFWTVDFLISFLS